jgi:hypothetical protein
MGCISPTNFSNFIMDPLSQPTYEQRVFALVSTIVFGILSFGLIHAGCAIHRAVYYPRVSNRTHQIITELFKRLIHHQSPSSPQPDAPVRLRADSKRRSSFSLQPWLEPTQENIEDLRAPMTALRRLQATSSTPFIFLKDDQVVKVWCHVEERDVSPFSQKQILEIQESQNFSTKQPGRVIHVALNDECQLDSVHIDTHEWPRNASLPQELADTIHNASAKALAAISSYKPGDVDFGNPFVKISAVQRNVKEAADLHLQRCTDLLDIVRFGPERILAQKVATLTKASDELHSVIDVYRYAKTLSDFKELLEIFAGVSTKRDETLVHRIHELQELLEAFTTQYASRLGFEDDTVIEQWLPSIITRFHQCTKDLVQGSLFQGVQTHTSLNPRIKVSFLQDTLAETISIDTSGLSRGYLDQICRGLIQGGILTFLPLNMRTPKSDVVPVTSISSSPETLIPDLLPAEREQCERLGRLFMYCYNSIEDKPSPPATTGHFFDNSLFAAALVLTHNELSRPFHELPLNRLIDMAEAIVRASEQEAPGSQKFVLDILLPACMIDLDAITPDSVRMSALLQYCVSMDGCDGETSIERLLSAFDENPTEFILHHRASLQEAKRQCLDVLFSAFRNSSDSSKRGGIAAMLAPIHAIACGMTLCSTLKQWDRIRRGVPPPGMTLPRGMPPYLALSEKIQGSLDRKRIADGLIAGNSGAQRKTQWLREWILDSTTCSDADLRNFLRWATGSSGIPTQIKVISSYTPAYPIPGAYTCFACLCLHPGQTTLPGEPNDGTKAGFLHFIKIAINGEQCFTSE